MSSKSKIILSISVLAIVAIVIYLFSATYPWIVDDVNYQFNLASNSPLQRINSIIDIFTSQWYHYFTVNGRYVAHWIVQLFCGLLGQQAFAICNAFAYVVLILLVLNLGGGSFYNPLSILSASVLTFIVYDTIYAPAFQVGYVWMFVLVFIWIHLFFNTSPKSILNLSLLFVFSIIAGNGHEAISLGISGSLIIYAIYNFKKFTISQWVSFYGFGLGTLLICISPGTLSRSENLAVSPTFSIICLLLSLRTFYILIIIVITKYFSHSTNLKKFYSENSFIINAITILFIFNILIGVGGNRQLFGIEALSIILILRLLKDSCFSKKVLTFLVILIATLYFTKWNYISHAKSSYDRVSELYSKSITGNIFHNLTRSNYHPEHFQLVHSANFLRYDYMGYKYVSKLFQSETGDTTKVLKIYPKCLQNINDSTHIENQVVEFDEGCFVAIQSKENPADFTLKRTLDLYFYKRPHSDYKFSWDEPMFEGSNYKANIIYQAVPFVTNDSIIIE